MYKYNYILYTFKYFINILYIRIYIYTYTYIHIIYIHIFYKHNIILYIQNGSVGHSDILKLLKLLHDFFLIITQKIHT